MLSVMVWLQSSLFEALQLPKPSNWQSCTSYRFYRISSAESTHSFCICSSSLICLWQKLPLLYFTVEEIVPISQPHLSSLLSLPNSVSASSSCSSSPSSSLSEIRRLLRLSLIAFNIYSDVVLYLLVVDCTFAAFHILSCFCMIAVIAYSTFFLFTLASLFTESLMHSSFSLLFKKCVSHYFSAESFIYDHKWCNTLNGLTHSAFKLLLPSFAWWCHYVDSLVDCTTCRMGFWRPCIGFITHRIGTCICRIGECKSPRTRSSLKSQFLTVISPISSDRSLSCAQLYHHQRRRSWIIPLNLSVPRSWVNTEYSIHQVQHTPSTAYTKYSIHQVQHHPRSTVSRSQAVSHLSADVVVLNSLHSHNFKLTMNRVPAAIVPPSKLTASNYCSNLARW